MTLQYRSREPARQSDKNKKPPLLLLLHGIGADENDLFGLAPALDARFFIVSARAPFALPYGGFAWFELYIEPGNVSFNAVQFEESRRLVLEFVDEIVAEHDLDEKRIFLGGFSQGAMISLSAVFSRPDKFAGVVAMSGRAISEILPGQKESEELKDLPVLVTHGIYDQVLPIENGRATRDMLARLPVKLEYQEYPMAHGISPECLHDVADWLRSALGD